MYRIIGSHMLVFDPVTFLNSVFQQLILLVFPLSDKLNPHNDHLHPSLQVFFLFFSCHIIFLGYLVKYVVVAIKVSIFPFSNLNEWLLILQ